MLKKVFSRIVALMDATEILGKPTLSQNTRGKGTEPIFTVPKKKSKSKPYQMRLASLIFKLLSDFIWDIKQFSRVSGQWAMGATRTVRNSGERGGICLGMTFLNLFLFFYVLVGVGEKVPRALQESFFRSCMNILGGELVLAKHLEIFEYLGAIFFGIDNPHSLSFYFSNGPPLIGGQVFLGKNQVVLN